MSNINICIRQQQRKFTNWYKTFTVFIFFGYGRNFTKQTKQFGSYKL